MNKLSSMAVITLNSLLLCHCSVVKSTSGLFRAKHPPITKITTSDDYLPERSRNASLNGIAAKVNNRIVTTYELNFELSVIKRQLSAQYPSRGENYYKLYNEQKNQVFQDLIDRELIFDEFGSTGAKIAPRELDREIQRRINNKYNGRKSDFFLALKKNKLSKAKHRLLVERSMIVHHIRSKHLSYDGPPTASELRKEYAEFSDKVRDISKEKIQFQKILILKSSNNSATGSPLDLAKDVAKQIREGASFSKLAQAYSADPYAKRGGQWPITQRIDLPAAFAPLLFKKPVGSVLGPLEDPNGYHIFKILHKIKGPTPPLSKIRPELIQRIKNQKSSARFNRWLERRRKKADIIYFVSNN